jgi:hypothetical protein
MLVSEFAKWYATPVARANAYGFTVNLSANKRKPRVLQSMQGVGSHDKNDCSIQAMTNALLLPYDDCKAIAGEHGWNPKRGIWTTASFDLLLSKGFSATVFSCRTNAARELLAYKKTGSYQFDNRSVTLGTWLKTPEANQGVYIIAIPGHVFCVRDGTIYDARNNSALSRLVAVYKLNQG